MPKKGFTLIELSIVIVIIGLIVVGIIGGQTLIEQSRLKNIINENNKYQTALNIFFLEYRAYPGDMVNAYDYWGSGCAASEAACNGNGDRRVLFTYRNSQENYMVWRHLNLAELIPSNYTGVHASGGLHHMKIGENVPKSSYSGGGWYVGSNPAWISLHGRGDAMYLGLGSESSDATHAYGQLLSPPEAYALDVKVDDGVPYTGNLNGLSGWPTANVCVSGSGGGSTYRLNFTEAACQILIDLQVE